MSGVEQPADLQDDGQTLMSDGSGIDDIAGRHLGRDAGGNRQVAYVTPVRHDPELLVAIPRQLNREGLSIGGDVLPFVGVDVWNCHEVSFLLAGGCPVNLILRLHYPADSPAIVESKSLKLYLNSFNMERSRAARPEEAVEDFLEIVRGDLSRCIGAEVTVTHASAHDWSAPRQDLIRDPEDWMVLEEIVDIASLKCATDRERPELLRESRHDGLLLKVRTSALRSNCRITYQPDWGDLFVLMKGGELPGADSLLRYVVSMRSENHFHEEIAETVYVRLADFAPAELFVACLYTRRGGIDINPARASSPELLRRLADVEHPYLQKRAPRQ